MAGIYRTGLDYGAMGPNWQRAQGVSDDAWPGVFADIQVMEAAAVNVFSKRAEDRAREDAERRT